MTKPETFHFGLLPAAQRRLGVFTVAVELNAREERVLREFVKSHGPETPFSVLERADADLFGRIRDALTAVAGDDELDLQWPDDIVMDYFPDYYD